MTRLISYEIKAKLIYLIDRFYSLCPCQYVSAPIFQSINLDCVYFEP